ncbi:MAG: glycosyltransferase family 2 protein [Ruthenibacterium sp.]
MTDHNNTQRAVSPQGVSGGENALVSIIIPVYNAAPHLARCIESVRRQTYRNLEILLINDGSSDTSGPICRMYARVDARIHVTDKDNSGVSATRNLALRTARGKYIQFVDSDDYLPRGSTALLTARMESTHSDFVIADYYRVDGERLTRHGFLRRRDVMDQTEFARELMDEPASFYYGVLWNKLYRADIIRTHSLECLESLDWSEDFLFNLEYIRYAQRFCALDSPVYYYVKNPESLTHTKIDLRNLITTKSTLFTYYKDLYTRLGLYEKYKPQIYKYLIASAEHS